VIRMKFSSRRFVVRLHVLHIDVKYRQYIKSLILCLLLMLEKDKIMIYLV